MAGKHVDWRTIEAFPDYEINPIGEVRNRENKNPVPYFQHHGEWAYTLTRWTETLGESWVVTKNGLLEVCFPDKEWRTEPFEPR